MSLPGRIGIEWRRSPSQVLDPHTQVRPQKRFCLYLQGRIVIVQVSDPLSHFVVLLERNSLNGSASTCARLLTRCLVVTKAVLQNLVSLWRVQHYENLNYLIAHGSFREKQHLLLINKRSYLVSSACHCDQIQQIVVRSFSQTQCAFNRFARSRYSFDFLYKPPAQRPVVFILSLQLTFHSSTFSTIVRRSVAEKWTRCASSPFCPTVRLRNTIKIE